MSHVKHDGGELSQAEQDKQRAQDNLEAALKTKTDDLASREGRPTSRTADEGMTSTPNINQPPSGALDHGGQRVAIDRSRRAR